MDDKLSRIWTDLVGRLTGPLTLRLFLQPVMSSLFAVRDGWKDAKARRSPYLGAIFSHPDERRPLITDGLKAIGKIFVFAVILDAIYQLIVFRRIYPVETLDVGILLAIVPYALLRGPINRVARWWMAG
jgi:hypothetical protein